MPCEKIDEYATKKSCGFLGLSLVILLSNQQTE